MPAYQPGQHVMLRSGKVATITKVLADSSMAYLARYQVRLPDKQLMGVQGTDVLYLTGPQALVISPSQQVIIRPRQATQMPPHWPQRLRGAFFEAVAALKKTLLVIDQVANQLGVADPSDMMQDIVFASFRLPYASTRGGKEDYRRLFAYVTDSLKSVLAGLQEDKLELVEIAAQYQVKPEGGTMGGYVMAGALELLSIWYYGDDHRIHASTSTIKHLQSPIHLNFVDLMGDSWRLTQTLIHEATHKFIRTVDHVYLSKDLLKSMNSPRQLALALGLDPFEQMQKALQGLNDKFASLQPLQTMNNADSLAMFVMWVEEHC